MKLSGNQFSSIEQVTGKYLNQNIPKTKQAGSNVSFEEILNQKKANVPEESLVFSKHAVTRLSDRNIELTTEQIERLETGTRKAGEKGIRESLVIVDQLSFIVNTNNKTVITAMEQSDAKDNIYTNIDGAVIV